MQAFKDHPLFRLVAVAILEDCCMAFADTRWLFYSGERIVAMAPLFIISEKIRCGILFESSA